MKEENILKKKDQVETICVYPQSFSQILSYMRTQKAELLKNKDLASYYESVNQNNEMLKNFSNYANTSLNIKDKVRILMHIKEEILVLSEKIVKLEDFRNDLEELKKNTQELEAKFSEENIIRLKKLIERSE